MCPRMVTVGSRSSNSKHPKSCRNEQEMNQVMYIANPNCNLGAEKHGELLDKQNASTSLGVMKGQFVRQQHPSSAAWASHESSYLSPGIALGTKVSKTGCSSIQAMASGWYPPLGRNNESGPPMVAGSNKHQASVAGASRRPMRECQDDFCMRYICDCFPHSLRMALGQRQKRQIVPSLRT